MTAVYALKMHLPALTTVNGLIGFIPNQGSSSLLTSREFWAQIGHRKGLVDRVKSLSRQERVY